MEGRKPERVDGVPESLGPRTQKPVADGKLDQAQQVEPQEFEAALQIAGGRGAIVGRRSLREEILEFVVPRVTTPEILRSENCVPMLEQLISDVLPKLGESQEFCALAAAVIINEITLRRDLDARVLDRGIAA